MLPACSVRLLPDGSLVFEGMSREAFGCSFRCEMAWWHFRRARRAGDFGGMVAAELRARRAGDELTTILRAEGWREAQMAALLRCHQQGADDPDWPNHTALIASQGGTAGDGDDRQQ